jgi:hypothetical protein
MLRYSDAVCTAGVIGGVSFFPIPLANGSA